MRRGIVFLTEDAFGEPVCTSVAAEVALARCRECRRRTRVLPSDVLAGKVYSLPVIEQELREYARGDRSLRQVCWSVLGDRVPAPSTLHGWSEGLGAHGLGRTGGEVPGAEPVSRLVGETLCRFPELKAPLDAAVLVPAERFRSEPRRERLEAGVRLLRAAASLPGAVAPRTLPFWRAFALRHFASSPLGFPTGRRDTPLEQRGRRAGGDSDPSTTMKEDRCPIPTRSPCGVMNRSPPWSTSPSIPPFDEPL